MGYLLAFSLALGVALPAPALLQPCSLGSPSAPLRFADVGADHRVHAHRRLPGSLDPLYSFVRMSLDVIQQNAFPTELLRDALNDPPSVRTSQILQYQTGYIICATVAILYFVALPATGLSICCCRRHRRCGGRIKAYRRSLLCQRNLLMFGLLLTTLVILGGVICAFAANQKVKEEMGPGAQDALNTLQALRHHVNGIPQGVQWAVAQFAVPKDQILHDLNNISWSIGSTIHLVLKGTVYSAMAAMKARVQDLQNSQDHLQALNATVLTLIRHQEELEATLKDRKHRVVSLLEHPRCTYCVSALGRAQNLEAEANYRKVPSVERVLKTLHGLPKADFSEIIHQANSSFNSIPELAVVKMAELIRDLKVEVEKATKKIQSVADGFPISDHSRPMAEALMKTENSSRPYLKEVKRYEQYRWIAGIVACTVVLLIVLCNILGLSLGAYGLAMREDPSDYESRGEAGAKLLITGVGFSFLFSWLLMPLVFGTFLVGGNMQTLVCKPWANQEIYKFIDTPGNLPPSMNVTEHLGLRRDLNLTAAYQQCKNGASFCDVLPLERSYNLNEHLDVAKYTAEFQKRPDSFEIRFQEIVLLNADGKKDLETFRDSKVDQIDIAGFTTEIRKPVVKTSLVGLAVELEGLSKVQSDRSLAERLAEEARNLRKIQNMTVLPVEGLVENLKTHVQFLSAMAPGLQALINGTLSQISQAEALVPVESQKILRQELACFVRKEVGYISQYLDWLRIVLTEDVTSCQPFSTALDNGRVILCDRIIDPWNAFWFSLGCCTLFLIPSIFFAIKIIKHFRPIRHRLVSTGSEETYPFHIPRVTSLRL
ncbi:hypothetical protein JRQ81_011181 [Phrynocephalus forsythii]|uniref:Prominin-2 n=1 Tax=Phrynocephalus forsythii TaxID=171643 RepID=A0A9Q0XAW4_9SAUR|nr:hypothetical protein JRQ81_011181 [Phrynocephalus forsythii]